MYAQWRCDSCGPVDPFHVADHISTEILHSMREVVLRSDSPIPMWCPWPLPSGWTVTGAGWAGDERQGATATAVAVAGPAPVVDGPADIIFVAEHLGVGLGNRLGGIPGPDAGAYLRELIDVMPPHAKIRAAGHPTPLWAVSLLNDRSAYVGEARGLWLYAIAWPASAGYLLADHVVLHDLVESVPSELVFGAPSPVLHGAA
jgi:hypothetical protein